MRAREKLICNSICSYQTSFLLLSLRFNAAVALGIKFRRSDEHRTKSSASAGNVLCIDGRKHWKNYWGRANEKEFSLIQFIDTFNLHQLKWNARSCTRKLLPATYYSRFIFCADFFFTFVNDAAGC